MVLRHGMKDTSKHLFSYTILIHHLIHTLTMLRTPARQAILAASRSTRSSIIARSLSTAPKRASVLYVSLSVFCADDRPRIVLQPIALSRSRFHTTPFLCGAYSKIWGGRRLINSRNCQGPPDGRVYHGGYAKTMEQGCWRFRQPG